MSEIHLSDFESALIDALARIATAIENLLDDGDSQEEIPPVTDTGYGLYYPSVGERPHLVAIEKPDPGICNHEWESIMTGQNNVADTPARHCRLCGRVEPVVSGECQHEWEDGIPGPYGEVTAARRCKLCGEIRNP